MSHDAAGDGPAFLSTAPARRGERLRATTSLLVFAILAPFAKQPLAPVWGFIPVYESALVVNDLVTAVLLFGQFRISRSPSLSLLASGYLFTALLAIAHALTFPGLFAAGGLLGAGPQSTAWLYMLWHGGFPLFVIGYALLKGSPRDVPARGWLWIPAATVLAAVACVLMPTAGQQLLPALMQGGHFTSAQVVVISCVWAASLAALIVLLRRGLRSVLDLWLAVVMCAWLADIALSGILNAARFDLGFYAGRIYGLLAASFVLFELLLENGRLYARLVEAHTTERRRAEELRVARDEAQSANVAKGVFLANMSHEIRTPMNAVIGLTHLALDTPLSDQQRDYLTKAYGASKALLGVLNDILDFSKVEAGKLTLEGHWHRDDRGAVGAAIPGLHAGRYDDPQQLIGTLLRWIRPGQHGGSGAPGVEADSDEMAALRQALPGVAIDAALARLAGNAPLYQRLLRVYLQKYSDAGETLRRQFASGELPALGAFVHGIAGEASMLGFVGVAQRADRLARMVKQSPDGAALPTLVVTLADACDQAARLLAHAASQALEEG
jgi:HPt (histidine-containing phosphotransfer) domain-containing protein